MSEFDSASWDRGWKAAKREHKKGTPPSQSYIGNSVDFRNGMTAYRDEHGLSDEEFDHRKKTPIAERT